MWFGLLTRTQKLHFNSEKRRGNTRGNVFRYEHCIKVMQMQRQQLQCNVKRMKQKLLNNMKTLGVCCVLRVACWVLRVEANLRDKPSEFALICPFLISGYQLYYCSRRQYTGRMITWHLLMRVAFCSYLKLMCAPHRCGQTVHARAPTWLPSNKCGRFRELEPKQRDLSALSSSGSAHPVHKKEARHTRYITEARHTRYVTEWLANGISVQIGCFGALNEHCTRPPSITSTSSLDARLQWRWYGGRRERHNYIAFVRTSVVHETCY
jgi:hypothetical protein